MVALVVFPHLVAGCGSVTGSPNPDPSAVAEKDADWFCRPGAANQEWRCDRHQEPRRSAAARPAPPLAKPPTPKPRAAPHRELAYRPGKPIPLTEVPPDYYVVQLVALETKAALDEYAARKELKDMSAARVERDGKLFYVLLLGVYPDRQRAEEAAANLPAKLEEFEPWVRLVDSLQQAIRRGDELAGTSEI